MITLVIYREKKKKNIFYWVFTSLVLGTFLGEIIALFYGAYILAEKGHLKC